jgi:uncharacterized membrane-anchored protein
MKNKSLIYLVILFQVLVLAGMFAKAFYPVMVGTPIKLKVLPIDPRDLFRGNYVNLNYDFSRIDLDSVKTDLDSASFSTLTYGDIIFVELALDSNNEFHEPVGLWQNPNKKSDPATILLKGTRRQGDGASWNNSGYNTIAITAGIESFFTDKENALSLENKMRPNWSFNPDKEEYIVWSEVYVTDEGAVRMSAIDFREAGDNERRIGTIFENTNLSEEDCHKKMVAIMYKQSGFKEEVINSQISLIKLDKNYKTDCYSNGYFSVIKIKSADLDTLFLTNELNYTYDLEFVEEKNNIVMFEKYQDNYNSTSMFYIIDLNKKKLYITPFFDKDKSKEKYKFYQSFDTTNFDAMSRDNIESYELKNLRSIMKLPVFDDRQED